MMMIRMMMMMTMMTIDCFLPFHSPLNLNVRLRLKTSLSLSPTPPAIAFHIVYLRFVILYVFLFILMSSFSLLLRGFDDETVDMNPTIACAAP